MKNTTAKSFILLGIITFSSLCFGQKSDSLTDSKFIKTINQSKIESNEKKIQTISTQETQTVSNGQRRKVLTTQEKIRILEGHIEAIDIKVNHINADKDLKSKAIEDNWFEKMQAIREEVEAELIELKSE